MATFAIIPAAGRSTRMGTPKLLLPWEGGILLDAVLRAWQASQVDQVVVVAHPDDSVVAAHCRAADMNVVVPQLPPAQMKDSVAVALAWIEVEFKPTVDSAWLLAPADMPHLSATIIDALIAKHCSDSTVTAEISQPTILVPKCGNRRGHPVLFPWSLAAAVSRLAADEGVNALLRLAPVRELELGPAAIPADIDTLADYQRQRKR